MPPLTGSSLVHACEVHEVTAVYAKETEWLELGLELGKRDRREIAVVLGVQVGVVVLRHDEVNLAGGNEQLLAALLDGDALVGGRAALRGDELLDLADCLYEAIGLDRLYQVIGRVYLERLDGKLAVRGHENDVGRILELVLRLLQAAGRQRLACSHRGT